MHRNIFSIPNVSFVASAIADSSRAKMLFALINTDGMPAGALALAAGIKPQTASSHLNILEKARLVTSQQIGRHRYYRIASQDAADVIECLARFSPLIEKMNTRDTMEMTLLKSCRTCYGHLAGEFGVAFFEALKKKKFIDPSVLKLKSTGIKFFKSLGLGTDPFSETDGKNCLDWTQRKYHLGGILGRAIAKELFQQGFLRRSLEGRSVRPTRNTLQLCQALGLNHLK